MNGQTLGVQEADLLYDRYVKPLENAHHGQYVGVSLAGKIVFGSALTDVVRQAAAAFGKGNSVVFRVGDKAVGRVR